MALQPVDANYSDLNLEKAAVLSEGTDAHDIIVQLMNRVTSVTTEQQRIREWAIRADRLYLAEDFTGPWGADLWPEDPSATTEGSSHVSINTPSVYVDVPAALQGVPPIETMLPTDTSDSAVTAAAMLSRVRQAWKMKEEWDLKYHKTMTVRGLYGRTAAKVVWDPDEKYPEVEIVEQPRNLYLGWKTDSYDSLEWAAQVQRMEPNAVVEEFGVEIEARVFPGGTGSLSEQAIVPFVAGPIDFNAARPTRPWLVYGAARIEVWDYYWRKPVFNSKGKFLRMETWNCVVAGNQIVRPPTMYPEYGGRVPFVPVFNSYIPGVPDGRPYLFDMEPLLREKWERVTSGSQMIADGTAGQYWQLTGPEAPTRVSVKPMRNQVVGPGAGNRIEAITPYIAQFELEQFLGRLDRESTVVSGLNDLLLGLAPSSVLSSSKAVNALIANYESRIMMSRGLGYKFIRDVWEMVVDVWVAKASKAKVEPSLKAIAMIMAQGGGYLQIEDPSLNPKDELETATRVINLMNAKLYSQRRAMSLVGVDDPETEQKRIREERTDATLFPADVQVMAQLMSALQSLGLQANQATQGQAQQQLSQGQSDLQKALGAAAPNGTTGQQGAENPSILPPGGEAPGPGGAPPGAPLATPPGGALPGRPGGPPLLQTSIKGGALGGATQIRTQASLGRR